MRSRSDAGHQARRGQQLSPGRRRVLRSVLALTMLPLARVVPAVSAMTPEGRFVFDIALGGDGIGRQELLARHDGDTLVLEHQRTMQVKLLGFEVYSAQHRSEEHWRDGRLVRLRGGGVESGTARQVDGDARGDHFELRYRADGETPGTARLPADVGTTNAFWTTSLLQRTTLVDSADGERLTARFDSLGEQLLDGRPTRRFALAAGSTEAEVWFTEGVLWRALFRHDGHEVDYRRRMPANG